MEMKNEIREGLARILLEKGVFFNPEMELCRDISSLAVGALGEKLSVCDGCCAAGVRGIRYKLENKNVARVEFVDLSERACKLARKNIKLNRLRACSVHCGDLNLFLYKKNFDLLEIDPFGSPVPYLYAALRSFARVKEGILSVTATDMAVLCGAHPGACLKNYQARPIDNEFCHELAARILIGKIARTASEFNLGIGPLLTLSHQHFIKIFLRVRKGAKHAVESMRALGY
ncbi:MAG: methyltransferase, partial [Candidatus Micrarchaeota archaeon]